MTKQPFLPLFFGAFLASTAEWRGEECSLFLSLLGYQWTLGSLPEEPEKLCRLVRWERKTFDKYWPQVSVKFVVRDGRLFNERLEDHRAKSDDLANKNSISGKKGAAARWRNDGERHSERHVTANSERHEKSDGVTDGIHPIPSHPIPVESVQPTKLSTHPKRKLKRTIPEDFGLTPERQQYAEKHLPNVDASALMDVFRSSAKAKGWEYADWDQHWQTLVRQWAPNSGHWSTGQYPSRASTPDQYAAAGWKF